MTNLTDKFDCVVCGSCVVDVLVKRQRAWPRVAQVDAGGPRPAFGEKRFVTSVWATEAS